jgi:hypothetical protein
MEAARAATTASAPTRAPLDGERDAFVFGLPVNLEPACDGRSDRESGRGRCDGLVRPRTPGRPGATIEPRSLGDEEPPRSCGRGAAPRDRDRVRREASVTEQPLQPRQPMAGRIASAPGALDRDPP